MKAVIQHPTYGEIIYAENFWSGKKALTVNGLDTPLSPKKECVIDGKKAVVKGGYLTGVNLCIESETVAVVSKPKWYEVVLAVIPFIFLMIWGNSKELCSIFPVVGGAIGGGLGGLVAVISLFYMKKSNSLMAKILTAICVLAITVLIAFAAAIVLIELMA